MCMKQEESFKNMKKNKSKKILDEAGLSEEKILAIVKSVME